MLANFKECHFNHRIDFDLSVRDALSIETR